MAQKDQQQVLPLAPDTRFGRSEEAGVSSIDTKTLRNKKRMRCLLYVVIFAIFQIGVITLFALTVAKFRNPKFRVRSATFGTFNVNVPAANGTTTDGRPSFDIRMVAELGVRNTNFGDFRYRNSKVEFYYGDSKVGEAFVDRARVRARSTRKFKVTVDLSSRNVTGNTNLRSDIGNGILPLTSRSRLRGRVKIMVILKKNRNANMDCTMNLVVATRELQNVICR